ncbi:MAG: protein kinase, partial [Propionicimonas sp.]
MADVIAGRYVLLSSLGRGGMGEVFLADDLVLGRRVAIKRILTSGSAPDRVALERLVREARLAATLHHPNVVAVHDLVTDGDRTHIVMEFVDSRSLAEMIRAKKRLEPVVAGRIGTQIASA